MNQHRRLAALSGRFVGTDHVAPTQWGLGGAADAELSASLTLEGFWLTLDHVQRRDGKAIFEAHARITWDTETSDYAMAWFDSYGFVPPALARGDWTGSDLVLIRTSPRGMARHSFRVAGEDGLSTVVENSFDGGASWSLVMAGKYRRV
ncbi:DUF1579 family protein [Bradyrhizobium prioriisuperbiae]|uniref:DUF1579 family protein n=1 Tax=Bradyrhizobium prioriisuperbiae TaxID=2854389 RepID=UPI0028E71154|nr:DUF1579 family protein [Bradyrhizobium prioritasuperba]